MNTGQNKLFVRKLMFRSLLLIGPEILSYAEALHQANKLRKQGVPTMWWLQRPLIGSFSMLGAESRDYVEKSNLMLELTLKKMDPGDVVRTYLWSNLMYIAGETESWDNTPEPSNIGEQMAMLKRITRKMSYETALSLYAELRVKYPTALYLPTDDQVAQFFGKEITVSPGNNNDISRSNKY